LVGWLGHGLKLPAGYSECCTIGARCHTSTGIKLMDILYLLIPLSVMLVPAIFGGL